MEKLARLAVLSTISTAAIAAPLAPALAYNEHIVSQIRASSSSFMSGNYPHTQVESRRRHIQRENRTTNNYHYEQRTQTQVHKHYVNPGNTGDTLAAGIVGLAAGAFLGNILKQPEQPKVVYQTVPQTQVVYQTSSTAADLSSSQLQAARWLQYCTKTYRSFNPKTGTFRGSDGKDYVCYAPL